MRALLRDIKGIFEVPNVHFLVSVSDEAARSLNLGALTGRDEFNSSFYTVIELPPAPPRTCAELLLSRGSVSMEVGLTLGILSGGNPREVLGWLSSRADRSPPAKPSSGRCVLRRSTSEETCYGPRNGGRSRRARGKDRIIPCTSGRRARKHHRVQCSSRTRIT